MQNLQIIVAIISLNDAKLNNLLLLKNAQPSKQVDDAIYERLMDLHNPSTNDDNNVKTLINALNL
jgi:hypothetical protein